MTSNIDPSPLSPLPSPFSSDVIGELSWRGLINQTTDDANLPKLLLEKPRTVYAGFDPTADSLHVGHLMALMILRRFQKAGHRPIAVVGGATGMIGDPSGKSEERKLLSVDSLHANIAGMEPQLRRFLDFDCGDRSAVLVNNYDWMGKFGYLEFLRDVGKHFPVNVMLTKDSVRNRLERSEAGMSYTEFSYMLLQAYDFVHLNQEFGCELQVGGSDQWGNITAGIDLARRIHGVQLYGCTCPLLTKSDGSKMGKSESGALWLSAEKTSPYQFYQYWINLDDADVGRCLRFFTDLGKEEIDALLAEHEANPGQRAAQRRLAAELTKLVHEQEGLRTAERATEIFFGAEISDLNDAQLAGIFADVPSQQLPRDRLAGEGLPIIDAFVESGLAKSKGDARRTITQGGAYVNNRRIDGIEMRLTLANLASESTMILRSGKKNYALLRFV
jgi:tyrosyl-tRNA synthetase